MTTCWLALGVSLRFLMAVPANALKLPATDDPLQQLWPNSDQEQQHKHAILKWQKREIAKHGARKGSICYDGCCGLGHRNHRTLGQAIHAWVHGQPLTVQWPSCNGVNSWALVQNEQVMREKFKDWIGPGDHSHECAINASNEPYYDPEQSRDSGLHAELMRFYRGPEHERLQHPVTKWYYAMQMIGFNFSPLGSIAARFLRKDFHGHGAAVIGVHLRLGNGEKAAVQDDRLPNISRHEVFRYVSQTADRIATEMLEVSPKKVRIFVASDTHSALEEFHKFDSRVFFFTGGNWLQDNQGVPIGHSDDEACADLEHTVMLEAVLMGYADVLLTPQWSELTAISKHLALSRGGQWCENQQWTGMSGNIPDPANGDIDVTAVRVQESQEDQGAANAMHEWEAILNGCPAEHCTAGYKCYYENHGLQSRVLTVQ